MSNANRLGGLVHRKGAPRPAEIPQRGESGTAQSEAVQPAAASVPIAQPAPAPAVKPPLKSLTLKLEEPEYEVLREFAHRQRKTHQEVMREALLRYLKQEGAQ